MLQLKNECYCSDVNVIPANWQKTGANTKTDWNVYFRFHDPRYKVKHPKGKLVVIKKMNKYKTLGERRHATQIILEETINALTKQDWNPVTDYKLEKNEVSLSDYIVHPETSMSEALQIALEKIKVTHLTKIDMKSSLKFFNAAAEHIYLDKTPVSTIKRRHIIMVLEQCEKDKGSQWSDAMYNRYRRNISVLFKYLADVEATEFNPITGVPTATTTQAERGVLSDDDRAKLDIELHKDNYPMWLFMNIFYYAGCRITELAKVKRSDVDLENQKFKVLKKKGKGSKKQYKHVLHTIRDAALPLWQEALQNCPANYFVFSKGLLPGAEPIRPDQFTRRWARIKVKYDITADLYSLKHLNVTNIANAVGQDMAARQANITKAMVTKHYDVNSAERTHEILRQIDTPFAPVKKAKKKTA